MSIAGLAPLQQAWKPAPDRRSLAETLIHIGDCIWWYCSRLDGGLLELESPPDESPIERVGRLVEEAEELLLAVPLSARAEIHIPARFPSADPHEKWTHTMVCRRQAEHLWEHLQGIGRAVQMAAEA